MGAAKKVAAPVPTARRLDTPAVAAAQLLTSQNLPGLIVVGDMVAAPGDGRMRAALTLDGLLNRMLAS
ncbi:MAG TPA: hypothetical protein VGF54_14520 [Streptosporangiaceae bacterium]|jgi:hypothetical protein